MNKRILFIDDDTRLLDGLRRKLHNSDYDLTMAVEGREALEAVRSGSPIAVAVCDMRMPGMDGVEVLEQIAKLSPNTTRIMLTGNADQKTAIDAVNKSRIFRFLTKPCPDEELTMALDAGIRQYQLVTAEQELLQQTLAGSIKVLTEVMTMVAPEAFKDASKIRDWVKLITAGLNTDKLWVIEIAALISPIGLMAIPENIQERHRLNKRLMDSEREILARAPQIASNLIANLPRMGDVAEILKYQWKGYDGSGVPNDNVAGQEIPYGARMLKILGDLASVTDGAVPDHQGIAHLMANREHYDPTLLDIITSHLSTEDAANGALGDSETVKYLTLKISALMPGDLLITDIVRDDGSLLLARSVRLSEVQVEKLRNINQLITLIEPVEVERHIKKVNTVAP